MAADRVRLTADQEREVRAILSSCAPDREVWAFGSRVRGNPKPYSDLDLVVIGDTPLPPRVRLDLLDAFEESDLPFRVDVVEWVSLGEGFRKIVEREHAVVQGRAPQAAPGF